MHPGDPSGLSPATLFGELLVRVQTEAIFPDSKTFAEPKASSAAILRAYRDEAPRSLQQLRAFVEAHFSLPCCPGVEDALETADLATHIRRLWPNLIRAPSHPAPSRP